MKPTLITWAATIVAFAAYAPPVSAALTLCQEASDCMTGCSTLYPYCCPTGETGTKYTCPSGWYRNLSSGLCTRNATNGDDSKGYYTQNYGTCSPETYAYNCFVKSATATSGSYSCMSCFQPGV